MRNISDIEIKEIIRLYSEEKISINKIKKTFKLQFEDVKNILKDNNVYIRSRRESRMTYSYDEDYFSEINTSEKAYWLGFIYADGFITKKTNGSPVFGLTLGEIEPLNKLNQCLCSNKPIGMYHKVNSYSSKSIEYKLAFTSTKMVNDLEKWGCVENKTFKIKFPTFLEEHLISHFIRGYFDGDGSVYLYLQRFNNKEYVSLGSQICGIESFLRDLAKYIDSENCIYKDTRKQTDCYKIQLNSNIKALKLYHYMYNNSNGLYLTRKKEKFDDFIKDRGSTTIISNPIYGNAEYKKMCYLED